MSNRYVPSDPAFLKNLNIPSDIHKESRKNPALFVAFWGFTEAGKSAIIAYGKIEKR